MGKTSEGWLPSFQKIPKHKENLDLYKVSLVIMEITDFEKLFTKLRISQENKISYFSVDVLI